MDPFQIRQALLEVKHLRRNILEKQLFRGYSGRARAMGGCVALMVGMAAQYLVAGMDARGIFLAWGLVFILALTFNYGAIGVWLLREGNRQKTDLAFLLEVVPVWIVGGILTLALWNHGQADLLYGSWMCLFGLAQSISRSRLPRPMVWIGMYYIVCGAICLSLLEDMFRFPVIMGGVFFIGELGAGLIMHASDGAGGPGKYFEKKA